MNPKPAIFSLVGWYWCLHGPRRVPAYSGAVGLPFLCFRHVTSALFVIKPTQYVDLALISPVFNKQIDIFHNVDP